MWTIYQAADEIRQGRLSPSELLLNCLSQIDRYEPKVQAWVFVDRDRAQAQCEALTLELKRGRYRGPLHGIPLGIKDIFDVFDWPTAAGSRLWKQSIARQDSTCVKRWRDARTPGGSSSGSAAALACGMCLGASSSQTGGSITRPAAFCGVAGCKPTHGRV